MQQQQSSSDGDVGGGGDNDEKADAGGSGGAANANAASQQMTTNERIEEDLVAVSTQLGEKTGPVFVCFFASETTQRDGSETERKRAKGRIVRKKPKNPSFSHALAGSSTIYELVLSVTPGGEIDAIFAPSFSTNSSLFFVVLYRQNVMNCGV